MNAMKRSHRGTSLIAVGAAVVALLVVVTSQLGQSRSGSSVALPAFAAPVSTDGTQLPRAVPQRAARALDLARHWRSDAVLDGVRTKQDSSYSLEFSFISPSDNALLDVTDANGRLTSQPFPPVTNAGPVIGIPLQFVDLADAVDAAKRHGMPPTVKEAYLEVSHAGGGPLLAWKIQPVTDHYPYLYTIDAAPGGAAAGRAVIGAPGPQPGPAPAVAYTPPRQIDPSRARLSPAAEALWQKADALYDRGDYRNALPVYIEAAHAGHPRAMAVVGNMYHEGQGVRQNPAEAVKWYRQASDLGNRSAQFSLGSMYEEGEGGLPKDAVKAAQLYELSARQGMPEAQFALGLSFEFGRGVPRNRAAAIFWLRQVAAQGDGRAAWYAEWLSRPDTPHFNDESALGQYTANAVATAGRPAASPSNGRPRIDPYFDHNSDYWRQR